MSSARSFTPLTRACTKARSSSLAQPSSSSTCPTKGAHLPSQDRSTFAVVIIIIAGIEVITITSKFSIGTMTRSAPAAMLFSTFSLASLICAGTQHT